MCMMKKTLRQNLLSVDQGRQELYHYRMRLRRLLFFLLYLFWLRSPSRYRVMGVIQRKCQKKIWRGVPWKSENALAVDPNILAHARETITYTATRSAVGTAGDGRKFVTVEFSAFTSDGWDENIGPRLFALNWW